MSEIDSAADGGDVLGTALAGGTPRQPKPPPFNAGETKEAELLAQLIAERTQQRRSDLAAILGQPAGRRVLWWLIDTAGLHADNYSESHAFMARAEGARQFAILLIRALEGVDHLAYPRLLADAFEDRKLDQLIHEARRQAEL